MNESAGAIRFVVPPQSEKHHQTLERLFRRVSEVSALPGVAQRVLSVAGDEHADAEDLLHVVEQDPTLVIRILRNVNSSSRGLRQEVADLRMAIALLGFQEVRNLALTVYVARLADSEENYGAFSRSGLWRHLVSVGEIARVVSRVCNRAEPEEAYLAGLLHDSGAILIDHYMNADWRRVLDLVNEGAPLAEAERHVLTFLQSELSAYVARQSRLPERVCSAIAYHTCPERYRDLDRELLNVLCLANYLAEARGLSALGVQTASAPSNDVYRGLGLRDEQLADLLQELEVAFAVAESLAGI